MGSQTELLITTSSTASLGHCAEGRNAVGKEESVEEPDGPDARPRGGQARREDEKAWRTPARKSPAARGGAYRWRLR